MTLTAERAREIIREQSQFPYWGNYSKFMTPEETAFVQDVFARSTNGNISIASIVQDRARSDLHYAARPNFDDKDVELARAALAAWDKIEGPRVGDWIAMLDGTLRRFTHAWPDGIQTTIKENIDASFHFSRGSMSFSGSLDRSIPRASIVATDETKEGNAWMFHHNSAGAHRGVHFTVPCRVFRQIA